MEERVKYYCKKPIVIKAFQYLGDFEFNLPDWVANNIVMINSERTEGFVRTLEGNMHFHYGDYLVQGIYKEVYVVKKEIFEESYEEVKGRI